LATDDSIILRNLDNLVRQTFLLWDEVWVGFYWRHYYYNHTQRVKALCLDIGNQEHADLQKLEYAALLHDITKRYDGKILTNNQGNRILDANGLWRNELLIPKRGNIITKLYKKYNLYFQLHNESGAFITKHILEAQGLPSNLFNSISKIVERHLKPDSSMEEFSTNQLEAKILYDADTIDANIGLTAFYRNIQIRTHFALTKNGNADLYQYIKGASSWINRKPTFLTKMMTASGSQRAQQRYEIMKDTYEKILEDVNHDFSQSLKYGLLRVIHYFMDNNQDPNLREELNYLLTKWIPQQRKAIKRDSRYKHVFQKAINFCLSLSQEMTGNA